MSVRATSTYEGPVACAAVAVLASLRVGAVLASALMSLDESSLSAFERMLVLRARAREDNHTRALLLQSLSGVRADEVRAALALTRRGAEQLAGLAGDLVRRLPQVLAAMMAGELDQARARVLSDWTSELC